MIMSSRLESCLQKNLRLLHKHTSLFRDSSTRTFKKFGDVQNYIKHVNFFSLMLKKNKLECLSLARLRHLPTHSSLFRHSALRKKQL